MYRAVRQGIRASVESYSIKRLEPLYGFKREIDLPRPRDITSPEFNDAKRHVLSLIREESSKLVSV